MLESEKTGKKQLESRRHRHTGVKRLLGCYDKGDCRILSKYLGFFFITNKMQLKSNLAAPVNRVYREVFLNNLENKSQMFCGCRWKTSNLPSYFLCFAVLWATWGK